MFSFNKRKQYNGAVDTKLNNEYQIATHDDPNFSGVFAYLNLVDNAWYSNFSADECAMYIAILYYGGMLEKGRHADAARLLERVNAIANFNVPKGLISQEQWKKFVAGIAHIHKTLGLGYAPK